MPLSLSSLKQRNNVVLLVTIFLGAIIAFGLNRILGGLLGAIIIYVLFRPLNIYLQEKKNWNKSLSTSIILVLSFFCLIVPIFLLVTLITDKALYYVNHPELTDQMFGNLNKFAEEKFNEPDLVGNLLETLKAGAGTFVSTVVNGAANTFIQIIVMYFTLFFTIKNFREFEKGLTQYLPFRRANSIRIGNELRNMTYSNILGQGCIAIIQGALLGLGFWIFGIPDPFFWGVIGAFLSMIPLFGSPLIFLPAGIIEMSNGNMVSGIGIIVYGYLIVTMVDNFIRMAIGKRIANTHPLITIIGVVIGIPIFGILGILYGPLIISLFIILAKIYRENRNEIIQLSGEDDNT
ncbi:MAG TPA: AI-2E family transporter [Chitinophagales bacterium]|nr:AI-2E family transporter [Chitinophagales bacterium]HRG27726.1 AI-2E family transporter [Chitinophagales bacterium]HRG84051.1 AI-2E family transporter [Chitinophagales bacterium]HRH52161.1 AI-2E family transporter [Chitinophagales bacterium]